MKLSSHLITIKVSKKKKKYGEKHCAMEKKSFVKLVDLFSSVKEKKEQYWFETWPAKVCFNKRMEEISVELHPSAVGPKVFRMPFRKSTPTPLFCMCVPFCYFIQHTRVCACHVEKKQLNVCVPLPSGNDSKGKAPDRLPPHTANVRHQSIDPEHFSFRVHVCWKVD